MHPGFGRTLHDFCHPNEICVESERHSPGFPVDIVATCVSIQNYVQIAQVLLNHQPFGSIQIPANQPAAGQTLFADAVMTGRTTDTTVEARYMNMSALKQLSTFYNAPNFGQIPGGAWSCVDCSNIGPVSVPADLDQLTVSVTLAAGIAGVLYITTAVSK